MTADRTPVQEAAAEPAGPAGSGEPLESGQSVGSGEPGDAMTPQSRVSFVPLSIVRDGEEFIVGSPNLGVFLSVPEIGVVALESLRNGQTIEETGQRASELAGEPVNVLEFAQALVEAGLVAAVDGRPLVGAAGAAAESSWIQLLRPETVRPLYSPVAWSVYGLLLAGCVGTLVAEPQLFPSFEDTFFYPNPALCVVAAAVTSLVLAACHEASHWFAAQAQGVGARFRVSRRLFFPVFETDVSPLWSIPRRRRYGPFLAGMAFDVVVLSIALGLRLAWTRGLGLPPLLVRFLGTVVLIEVLALGFQLLVFMRTDLYAVLITFLGCRNLYRVNFLRVKRLLFRLKPSEAQELENAYPRDLQVSRWFGVLYLAGLAWAGLVFAKIFVPSTVLLAGWMFHSLLEAPVASPGFWEALAIGVVAGLQATWPLAVYVWERRHR